MDVFREGAEGAVVPRFELNAPLSHVHGIDFVCFIFFSAIQRLHFSATNAPKMHTVN